MSSFFLYPLAGVAILCAARAEACEDASVRDAAFVEARDVYRLAVMAEAGDTQADETHRRLADWLKTAGAGLNLELRRVKVDDPAVRWTDYGIPSAPPTYPTVVLGRYRIVEIQTLFVDHWEPAPTAQELEELRTSPAREALQRELGQRLAVLLYIPAAGGDGTAAGKARPLLDAVVKAWSTKAGLELSVIQVSRSDPKERLLLSFTGEDSSGSEWVAVVFGRGKFMLPLENDTITEENLNEQLEQLTGDCTCVRSISSLGADIPMIWTEAMDRSVVRLRTPTTASATQPAVASLSVDHNEEPGTRIRRVLLWTFVVLAIVIAGVSAIMVLRPAREDSA